MTFCSWEAKRLLSLAVPVFLAQVTLVLMSVVDTIMAGQVSPTDLAALSIATGIWNPILLAIQGILLALTGVIAQFAGAKDRNGISHYFQQALYLTLLLSIAGFSAAQLANTVILQLDTTPAIAGLAFDYIHFVKWGVFGFLIFTVYRNMTESLCPEDVLAVVSADLARQRNIASAADLNRIPPLYLSSRPNQWEEFRSAYNLDPSQDGSGTLFDQFSLVISGAISGLGAALIPSYFIEKELANGTLQMIAHLPAKSGAQYYLVTPSGQASEPSVHLAAWLRREGKKAQTQRGSRRG